MKPDTPWEEMSAHERNKWLAEFVMGWRRVKQARATCVPDGECWQEPTDAQAYDCNCVCHHTPDFVGSIGAAYRLEEALEGRFKRGDMFVERLWEVVYGSFAASVLAPAGRVLYEQGFKLVHATPEQRAHAAYLVIYPLATEGRL